MYCTFIVLKLRVWDAITTKGHTDVFVPPSTISTLSRLASKFHIRTNVIVQDLQQ